VALLAQAFARKSGSTLDLFREIYGGRMTQSGRTVNVGTAIDVSTVFACCRVIGEGVAQVPFKLMRESADGKQRLPAKDHALYDKLAARPNRWQTSFEYRETLVWQTVLAGNHFSYKNMMGGRLIELFPFDTGTVKVLREDDGMLSYEVTAPNGSKRIFPAELIWHVRGPSLNSWYGLEAVKHAREAIGLAMATEEAVGRLHKNGVRPSGVYSVEGTLKDDQHAALTAWVEKHLAGGENTGKPMILDRAAKWTSSQMTGIDAQTLEQRRFQIEEICRFARVMPIMVGYSDKAATYASAEQMFLAHVVHTLAPWYQRLEQSADINLLTDKERAAGLYFNFVEEGLLRGSLRDTKDTVLGYVNGGILTPNEGRAKLDMNPDSDPASDRLRIPANIVGDPPAPDHVEPQADPGSKALAAAITQLAERPQPDHIFNIAGPTIEVKAGDTNVTLPEGCIQLDATINTPDIKTGDVLNNLPAPIVTMAQPRQTVETIERDADHEIMRITRTAKD
jgi:HK97 family phage portal protein